MENTFLTTSKDIPLSTNATFKRKRFSGNKKILMAADKGLLRKAVKLWRPQSQKYEDSWGYVIQATRYGGFRWYNPKTKSLIFFGRKSETNSGLVVPSFFAEPEYLANVLETVQKELCTSQTVLKNIDTEEVSTFLPYGFRPYTEAECWNSFARFDDQTFPQLIVKLENLVSLKGRSFKKLRNVLNKKPDLMIRQYNSDDKDKVLNLIALKDRFAKENKDKTEGLYYESHLMYPTADIEKFVICDKTTSELLGFTAISNISPKNTAFVASLFKPGIKVASVWGIYHTLLLKYADNFQFANLGGNENEGSYNFMRRTFHPFKKLAKTHLVFDPQ